MHSNPNQSPTQNANMNESKVSNVLGAKTARPCDSCLIKRARWFCAADDAFLCQSCDAAVHSANQLASRHQRVRLETSSCGSSPPPAWFTKKARTPRHPKQPPTHQMPLVPEIGSDDAFAEENDEEQLFCRVPVFDEFGVGDMVLEDDREACGDLNLEELLGSCEAELAEFAADVESLLGADSGENVDDGKRVKIEEEDDDEEVRAVIASHLDPALDVEMNWEFGNCAANSTMVEEMKKEDVVERKRMLLRLNYEAVIAAWATQGCPWTDGIRPHFDLDQFMGACLGGSGRKWAGREARVSRYREKRRTRLFSKKIRYEVRKLNAEKRPRMKGRFVKRTPFLGYHLPRQ